MSCRVWDIYLGLMSLSTRCKGYIMIGSFKDRQNQYILVGHDSALSTARYL